MVDERIQEIVSSLSPLARINVQLLAEWARGQGNPPCLVLDEVTPLCRRDPTGLGWVTTDELLAVADAIDPYVSDLGRRAFDALASLHRSDDDRPLCTGTMHVFPAYDYRCTCGHRNTGSRFRKIRVETDDDGLGHEIARLLNEERGHV